MPGPTSAGCPAPLPARRCRGARSTPSACPTRWWSTATRPSSCRCSRTTRWRRACGAPRGACTSSCRGSWSCWSRASRGSGRRGCARGPSAWTTQLLDSSHHVAVVGVDPVGVDEGLVGSRLIAHRQVGAAHVVEQAEGVLLADRLGLEAAPVPLDGQLGQSLVEEAQAEHRAARDQEVGILGRELELADRLVEQFHLAVGDAQVEVGVVVGRREVLGDAALEPFDDLLERLLLLDQLLVALEDRLLRQLLCQLSRQVEEVLLLVEEARGPGGCLVPAGVGLVEPAHAAGVVEAGSRGERRGGQRAYRSRP